MGWTVPCVCALATATVCAALPSPSLLSRNIMPRVIGHRGIPAIYPENTFISFVAALEAGADGIESDLHLTLDKVLVLLHDDTLDRTTNCTGYIGNYTLAALATCNANYASVFGDKYGFQPIPTFDQVVGLVASYQAMFVLDLKENALLGQYIRPVVDAHNASSLVAMSCWTFDQVADAVLYMNASSRQFLNTTAWGLTGQPGSSANAQTPNGLSPEQSLTLWGQYLSMGVRAFSMQFNFVTDVFVAEAHARLLPVFIWTADAEADINAMIDIGVDGILTNNVLTVLGVVTPRAAAALQWQSGGDAFTRSDVAIAISLTALGGIVLGAVAMMLWCRKYGQGATGSKYSSGSSSAVHGATYSSLDAHATVLVSS